MEVLRGPSTLLYGGGAVAGVINVIDGRIPETIPEKPRLMIQQSNNSGNSGDNTAIRIDTGFDRFALHINGYRRKNKNVDIKGFAIDELAVAAREELFHGDDHDDDHDDHDDHGDEETENTFGYLNNSDGEANGGTFGFSFVGDNGFFGVQRADQKKVMDFLQELTRIMRKKGTMMTTMMIMVMTTMTIMTTTTEMAMQSTAMADMRG